MVCVMWGGWEDVRSELHASELTAYHSLRSQTA